MKIIIAWNRQNRSGVKATGRKETKKAASVSFFHKGLGKITKMKM